MKDRFCEVLVSYASKSTPGVGYVRFPSLFVPLFCLVQF